MLVPFCSGFSCLWLLDQFQWICFLGLKNETKILNPNPDAMSKLITEKASEEFLQSLSNYCALQVFVEDQFGLGLIARAVEEGIVVIKPTGIMIFNMGGHPGQAVCKRLFERRGVRVDKLWQ